MAKKGITNTLVWLLMGLLILGLGGFGVTNLSGSVRSIGSVGDSDIDVDEYARSLQREIRALEAERGQPVSLAEARDMGVTESVLARLIASAAFDHETGQIGLSIGDENLRDEIVNMQQFQGVDGLVQRAIPGFGEVGVLLAQDIGILARQSALAGRLGDVAALAEHVEEARALARRQAAAGHRGSPGICGDMAAQMALASRRSSPPRRRVPRGRPGTLTCLARKTGAPPYAPGTQGRGGPWGGASQAVSFG